MNTAKVLQEQKEPMNTKETKQEKKQRNKNIWLITAFVALIAILLLPTPANLPVIGHHTLAILVFAVILWITEAVSYPVSSAMIVGLIALILGVGPTLDDPNATLGTGEALKMALSGFSNSAVILVAGALFIAAAMQATNLHKRIALLILSKVGSKTKNVLIGAILVSFVLALFVPSATARGGALVPILLGMVAAFGMAKTSKLGALLIITAVQSISIWNVGIKTAAAQNMVALGFIQESFGESISWGQWFMYAAPWSIIMSILLYFIMLKVIPPETNEIKNGQAMVKQQLSELGKLKPAEIRLIIISLLLLFFWSTENIVHSIDTTTVTLLAVAIMLTPKIGVFTWKEAESTVPWGTIIVFAVGISLGSVLLSTGAATWLANGFFSLFGLEGMPVLGLIALLAAFNIIIHLSFASATSLASALIPIFIALATTMNGEFNTIGLVIIQQFVISFGFLLPVNAPQNMLGYGTGTFTVKDFLKSGVPLTIAGYLLILLLSATYWKWIGLL